MMNIDRALFHDISIDLLYGAVVLLTFIIIERGLYYSWLGLRARSIAKAIAAYRGGPASGLPEIAGGDLLSRAMAEYIATQRDTSVSRAHIEDLSAALYLDVDARINARLWMLDTIVTAAPLLGLLGTILGIMDTFNALSAGGISDPAAVSRGIAAALLATALGIGTALYGLLGHNILHRRGESLTEGFKSFLLRTTV